PFGDLIAAGTSDVRDLVEGEVEVTEVRAHDVPVACLAVRLRAMKSTSTVWRFLLRASEAMKPCSAFSLAVFSEPCGSGTVTDCVIELAPFSSKMKDVFTIARGRGTRNPCPLSVLVCLITVDGVDASAQTLGVSEVPDVDVTVE